MKCQGLNGFGIKNIYFTLINTKNASIKQFFVNLAKIKRDKIFRVVFHDKNRVCSLLFPQKCQFFNCKFKIK